MSLLRPILRHALARPTATAVIDDRGRTSYFKLVAGAMTLARVIEQHTKARHVGLLLPTSGGTAMSILGAWIARRVAVPYNFLLTDAELDYVVRDSEADLVITHSKLLDHIGGRDRLPRDVEVLELDKSPAIRQAMLLGKLPPMRWPPHLGDEELAVILYTSGTSGKPKGVMLSHGNLHANVDDAIAHARLNKRDVFLGVLPQFHSFGLTALTLIPLYMGSTIVYSARFVPSKVVELIEKHRPAVFMAVPSMYGALLSVKNGHKEQMTSIRFAISGGEKLPSSIHERFLEKYGVDILEGYGLTETSPVSHWSTPWARKEGSVGTALPRVTVAVVDEQMNILPADREGEILLAGPNIMPGYFKLPEQTAETFVELDFPGLGKKRFFKTGDIGRFDDEGFLFITGRAKELIIIGGENVSPREIEEAINQHPDVHDSAVIGRPDDMRGEAPIAFIEAAEDASPDPKAIRRWLRDHLAAYKIPREIHLVDELPRSPTGKVLRRILQERSVAGGPGDGHDADAAAADDDAEDGDETGDNGDADAETHGDTDDTASAPTTREQG